MGTTKMGAKQSSVIGKVQAPAAADWGHTCFQAGVNNDTQKTSPLNPNVIYSSFNRAASANGESVTLQGVSDFENGKTCVSRGCSKLRMGGKNTYWTKKYKYAVYNQCTCAWFTCRRIEHSQGPNPAPQLVYHSLGS